MLRVNLIFYNAEFVFLIGSYYNMKYYFTAVRRPRFQRRERNRNGTLF